VVTGEGVVVTGPITAVAAEMKTRKSAEQVVAELDSGAWKDSAAYDSRRDLNIEGMAR
jgi:hypothetical protein